MKQHLIAIDLDGTALNDESKLTTETIETLRLLDRMGHKVCIITGRPFRNSEDIYKELNIGGPMVNFNGALCHIPYNPDWVPYYHFNLDRDLAFDIFRRQEEFGIDLLCAEGKNEIFASSSNLPNSPIYPLDRQPVHRFTKDELTYNPTALTLFTNINEQETIAEKLRQAYGEEIEVRTWGGFLPCLEVVRAGVNKALGVERIAHFYGVDRKNILAFGDEDNDTEMIDYAGHGVALANAIQPLKDIANDVTGYSNDEDGLARYLQKYFKL